MTTSIPHTHIRLRDLSQLVAGIPYVIGYPPTDSLVLFNFSRCPELMLSATIRIDLPKPEELPPVVAQLSAAVARNEAVAVVAVVVAENGEEHRLFVDLFRKALEGKDILLSHASWVPKVAHGELWRCYSDPLCTGPVPDPQTSALAAASAVAGDMTYPDRKAMAAHFAPDSKEALARRKKLLKACQPYKEEDLWADLELLGHILDTARSSYDPPKLTDHQLVRLARALSQTPVKDECLAIALSDDAEPAERLWTTLVRGLPAPERAEAAFLLAMSAYLRGAGVIAGLALRIVIEADPRHRTAVLLDSALRMGFPPDHLRALLMTSIINNRNSNEDPSDDDPPWDTTPEPGQPSTPEPASHEETEETESGSRRAAPTPVATIEATPVNHAVSADREYPATSTPVVVASSTSPTTFEGRPGPGQEPVTQPPRIAPGPLRQRAAAVLGVPVGAPVRRTVTMDALTAFLPPPTERSGPG
jgi:hypothetical protein